MKKQPFFKGNLVGSIDQIFVMECLVAFYELSLLVLMHH